MTSLRACTNPQVSYYFGSCHPLSVGKNRPPSPPTPEAQWPTDSTDDYIKGGQLLTNVEATPWPFAYQCQVSSVHVCRYVLSAWLFVLHCSSEWVCISGSCTPERTNRRSLFLCIHVTGSTTHLQSRWSKTLKLTDEERKKKLSVCIKVFTCVCRCSQ